MHSSSGFGARRMSDGDCPSAASVMTMPSRSWIEFICVLLFRRCPASLEDGFVLQEIWAEGIIVHVYPTRTAGCTDESFCVDADTVSPAHTYLLCGRRVMARAALKNSHVSKRRKSSAILVKCSVTILRTVSRGICCHGNSSCFMLPP